MENLSTISFDFRSFGEKIVVRNHGYNLSVGCVIITPNSDNFPLYLKVQERILADLSHTPFIIPNGTNTISNYKLGFLYTILN